MLTSFPNSTDVHRRIDVPRNGNVGYELLKRFSLVVDYPHQRLLLRPNQQFRDAFEHDMCGIDFLATGPGPAPLPRAARHARFAGRRRPASNPTKSSSASTSSPSASMYSLTQLSRIMHSENGRALLLVLRRPDGELHTTTVRLKRQI